MAQGRTGKGTGVLLKKDLAAVGSRLPSVMMVYMRVLARSRPYLQGFPRHCVACAAARTTGWLVAALMVSRNDTHNKCSWMAQPTSTNQGRRFTGLLMRLNDQTIPDLCFVGPLGPQKRAASRCVSPFWAHCVRMALTRRESIDEQQEKIDMKIHENRITLG